MVFIIVLEVLHQSSLLKELTIREKNRNLGYDSTLNDPIAVHHHRVTGPTRPRVINVEEPNAGDPHYFGNILTAH